MVNNVYIYVIKIVFDFVEMEDFNDKCLVKIFCFWIFSKKKIRILKMDEKYFKINLKIYNLFFVCVKFLFYYVIW